MTLEELNTYKLLMCAKYPEKANKIRENYETALCEIEDGESESHECELAYSSIKELTCE